MDGGTIREQQTLVWAERHAGTRLNQAGPALSHLDALLGGSPRERGQGIVMLDHFVAQGVMRREHGVLTTGPGFRAALDARRPDRHAVTEEDIASWEGLSGFRRLTARQNVWETPVVCAAISEALRRQAAGALEKVDITPKRVALADRWNDFVDSGQLSIQVVQLLRDMVREASNSYGMDELGKEDIPAMARHLEAEISRGFSPENDPGMSMETLPDRVTGELLGAGLCEWRMRFMTCRPEDDFAFVPVESFEAPPQVVHVEIPAGGDLCLLSAAECPEPLRQALHRIHVDDTGLDDRFNADVGARDHARRTLETTGIMDISLGDYFPAPVRDRETGRILLAAFGDVVSTDEAIQLSEEGDADFENGYFMVAHKRFEILDGGRLDNLVVAPRNALVSLLTEHADLDEAGAEALLADEEAREGAALYRFPDVPETLHLYMPFGRRVTAFEGAFDRSQLRGGLTGGTPGLLLSPDPVPFAADVDVEEMDVQVGRGLETPEP